MGKKEVKEKITKALGNLVSSGIDILGDTLKELIEENRDDLKTMAKEKIDKSFEKSNTIRKETPKAPSMIGMNK